MTPFIVIPARKGAKSKNWWELGGKPLIEWALASTYGLPGCVTSDDPCILRLAEYYGKEAVERPEGLRDGVRRLEDSIIHTLDECSVPDEQLFVLVQPTSPFGLHNVGTLVEKMLGNRHWFSGQTITRLPHNHHPLNLREVTVRHGEMGVRFVNEAERRHATGKQQKEERWTFGNVVATYAGVMRSTKWLFNRPSLAVEIDPLYAWDVDTRDDLKGANAFVTAGLITPPTFLAPGEYQI